MRKKLLPTQARSKTGKALQRAFDYPLFFTVVILSLIGLIMVYDSSVVQATQDFGDPNYYIKQQIIWVILGFVALIFFSVFDYRYLKKLAFPAFTISFVLLLAVFIPGLGVAAGGAHRWLRLGFFTIQPAEIIKLTSIVYFAALFEKAKGTKPFLIAVVLVTLILGILQKDLGSTLVFFVTSALMYLLAGAPLQYFIITTPIVLTGFLGFIATSTYRRQRILAFFDPFADPQGYSYQISQVLIALGSGNWFGLGLGQSRQKFDYIPEVTTDSIFSIVGEEFGFFGSVMLILVFSFLIARGFSIAQNSSDKFGKILGYGLVLWLGIQAALNLAAMVALVPLTGIPLPFISYGGSALLANLVAIGILLNISKHSTI